MAIKSDNSEIAVLQTQMEEVKELLGGIVSDVKEIKDSLPSKYATKDELKNFKRYAIVSTALTTAVITALVVFFFTHVDLKVPQPGTSTTTTTTTNLEPAQPTAKTTPTPTPVATSGGSVSVPLPQVLK